MTIVSPTPLPVLPSGSDHAEPATKRAAAIVDLVEHITTADSTEDAYRVLVTELERELMCRAVLLGIARSDGISCRLQHASAFWPPEETAAMEAVFAECLARDDVGIWPPSKDARHSLRAHQRLTELAGVHCVWSFPLQDRGGNRQGVLVVLGDPAFSESQTARHFLQAAAKPLASAITLVRKAEPNWVTRLFGKMGAFIRTRKFLVAFLLIGLVCGALAIPWPYRIGCDCQLEPVTRRFVAAPFDGTLERAAVEPGDLVSEGQSLALMDGREIRWELAGLVAEQSQAAKERDGHMAKHDFGAAQLAKLEMERLRLRQQLLQKRTDHLGIKSPIAGIVVTGDWKKSEGVPLSVGERLFEIAPLEEMVVEISIPEADRRWAEAGQTVEIVLDAYPETTWTGTLSRIHPRAELRDEEHVFVGEVHLENPDAVLRPGMRGRVKILGPEKPLGWNLFHKPWYELRYWLGW